MYSEMTVGQHTYLQPVVSTVFATLEAGEAATTKAGLQSI